MARLRTFSILIPVALIASACIDEVPPANTFESEGEERTVEVGPPVPDEAASRPAIQVTWAPNVVGRWQRAGKVRVSARIQNNGRQAIEMNPRLTVRDWSGHNVRIGAKQGTSLTIKGGGSRRVSFVIPADLAVAYTTLPMSVDVSFQQRGTRVVAHSPVRRLEWTSDFQQARVVTETPEIVVAGPSPLTELFRLLDDQTAGARVGILPDGSEVSLGRIATFPDDYLDRLPLMPPRPVPTSAYPYVLCFGYEAEFSDGGGPDDHLASPSLDAYPGSYSSATALVGGGDIAWSGVLDENGCTPPVMLEESEKAALLVRTRFEHANTTVRIRETTQQTYENSLLATFKVPLFADEPVVDLSKMGNHHVSRAAAVIARMMAVPDSGLENGGTLTVYAEQNCPGWPLSACYTNDKLYLGPNPNDVHSTDHKYVVAHEFGHAIADNYGALVYGQWYDEFYETEMNGTPECQCAHVPDELSSHCLQSNEDLGNAINEGFAHFLASKAFNDTDEGDCSFAYYKDYLDPDTLEEFLPPVWVDCTDAVQHRDTYCGGLTRRGTEHDWMNFFRGLHTDANNPIDMAGLGSVFAGTQTYPVPEAADVTNAYGEHWCSIDESANANLTLGQYGAFAALADDYGVRDAGQAPCN